jgi:hypothetical protein
MDHMAIVRSITWRFVRQATVRVASIAVVPVDCSLTMLWSLKYPK